jgi:hypothetical protein
MTIRYRSLGAPFVLTLLFLACQNPSLPSTPADPPLSPAKALTAFSFATLAVTGTVNESAHTVAVAVPYGTDVTALVATFSTSGTSVKVGSTAQVCGTTPNNFTSQVTYTVTAADASTQSYVVSVTIAPSSAKALTAFSFATLAVTGTVNEIAHTVAVTVPYGTDVTALVATFSTSGTSVKVGSTAQVSGTTPNNFTSQVTYTVTAADASTQSYVVSVIPSQFSAQWAQTLSSGTGVASFNGVSADKSGNVYAVGYVTGTGTFGFGNSVSAAGSGSGSNPLVVKYNSSGVAQWAQSLGSGTGGATFFSATTDGEGNLYTVGASYGTGSFGFGNGVTATGTDTSGYGNTLVVKYNSSGVAQWAQTLTAGTDGAIFYGVSIDTSGNVFAVGYTLGTGTFGFGNSVTATGTATGTNGNPLVVKYDSSGVAQWAQTLTSGTSSAWFNGVATDLSGNLYAVGTAYGTGTFEFGNSVTATGTGTGTKGNTLVVKYNSSGSAQWAQTLTVGTGGANLKGVSIDGAGNVYTVGRTFGTGSFGFGNGVTATGTDTSGYGNTLVVKYDSSGVAQWARTLIAGTGGANLNSVTTDGEGNLYAVGTSMGTGTFNFGNSVTATGSAPATKGNTLVLKYNSSGVAQWVQTLTSGTGGGYLNGVSSDNQGNLYAVGNCAGTESFGFGNAVTATGPSTTNSLVVKYLK